ncbi:MAG: squalene synthase HpnC [Gammaproteobacteria bacterium]|nr:squalene synthase HpnC [Gammaproteobacteria bacterium]
MATQTQLQIHKAYDHCLRIAHNHYENFPVASFLLPKNLRLPIAVIYAFARTADDFADEGECLPHERLAKLNNFEANLIAMKKATTESNIEQYAENDNLFIALREVIDKHQLPLQLFLDLLTAFKQDITKTRYSNIEEILGYCHYSANPVGRLLLHLTKQTSPQNLAWSDSICSALQLINFLQDIHQDYQENNRIYLPMDEMAHFGVTETHIQQKRSDAAMRLLIKQQLRRAKTMMLAGSPLGNAISGRFGLQLRLMINGGLKILKHLENQENNYFSRPRLEFRDWINIGGYALLKKTIAKNTEN